MAKRASVARVDDVPESIRACAPVIEAYLARCLEDARLPRALHDACVHALLGGGKRLRPALVMHFCEACGAVRDACLPAAGAVEMIHAFSLVHDDLPALDDDDMRRGRPTVHKAFGEALAVLVGDVLTSLAFQVIGERSADPALGGALAGELARGTTAMIAGQVYDTLGGLDDALSGRERLLMVHENKTGALIRAACRMGVLCAGGSPEQLDAATRYGDSIGLMFQIVDDLLDVEQTAEHIGKRTEKDAEAGKLTYPGVLGVEASRAEIARLGGEALASAGVFGARGAALAAMCEYLAVRTR